MERFLLVRSLLRSFLICFLIFPYLVLILFIDKWTLPPLIEGVKSLNFTLLQAALSSFFSVFFGGLGAIGLNYWKKYKNVLEVIFIIPNVFPVIFVIVSVLNLVPNLPFGIVSIVFIHTVINAGIVAIAIFYLIQDRLIGLGELCFVEGASQLQFFKASIGVIKKDLLEIFLFVFALCFTSFSIPLIVGGSGVQTLEVLIYEKVIVSGEWSHAAFWSFFQSIFLLTILKLYKSRRSQRSVIKEGCSLPYLKSKYSILPVMVISILLIFGLLLGMAGGIRELEGVPIIKPIIGTLWLGIFTGGLTTLIIILIAFTLPHQKTQNFLLGYIAPSSALLGFSLLILLRGQIVSEFSSILFLSLGISVLFVPSLFRYRWNGFIESVVKQIEVAQVLGASYFKILKDIILPQGAKTLGTIGGLASFWACGDFALSAMVIGEEITLGLLVNNLLASYKLGAASVIVLLIIFCGSLCYLIFSRGVRVICERFTNKI